jgi:Spy/CpxP family protein refolding chaperone
MKRWFLVGGMLLLAAATAKADPLGHLGTRWKWWENPKIKSELNLTNEQVTRIQELVRSRRDRLIDLRAAVEKKALLLSDEVDRPDFDATRASAAAEEVMKARTDLARGRMALLLDIRAVLSQEQFFKLRAMRHERKRHFMRRFPGEEGEPPMGPRE